MTQTLTFTGVQKPSESGGAGNVEPTRKPRSYSQLSSYAQCQWEYFLKRIMKVPEVPSVWFEGGKGFHSTGEAFDRATWNTPIAEVLDKMPVEYWQNLFEIEFDLNLDKIRLIEPDESKWRTAGQPTKARPNGEDVDWWRQAGRKFVAGYIAWRISTEDSLRICSVKGEPGIEVEVLTLLGDVPVIGFVDRLLQDIQTDVYLLVDQKSGKRVVTDTGQVGQYSVQIEQMYGLPVTYGAYYSARKGDLGDTFDLTAYTVASLGKRYQLLEAAIEAGRYAPSITSRCKACGVRYACRFQGGIEPTEVVS